MSVTLFISTVPVISYVYVFIKWYVSLFIDSFISNYHILQLFAVSSLLAGIIGGLIQRKIKKLIAYSSISTIGFLLAGLSGDSLLLVQYSLVLLVVYVLTIVPIFVILLNYRRYSVGTLDSIYAIYALFAQNRLLLWLLCAFFFSLAGVPPFAGFCSKLFLFAALSQRYLYGLLAACVVTALLSCYYYIKVIKIGYYDASPYHLVSSKIGYAHVYICVLLFLYNAAFISCSSVLEDVCAYISVCLFT